MKRFAFALCLTVFVSACATLPPPHSTLDLESVLNPSELEGIRWGIIVSDMQGQVLVEKNADQRFLPASNTKLVTTAAGFHWKETLDDMAPELSTRVIATPSELYGEYSDLTLVGRGDPQVQDTPDCQFRCLESLARQVADSGIRKINDVVADDSWFPVQKWVPGWSWEDLQQHYGTAVSALSLNENIVELEVSPSFRTGQTVGASWNTNYEPYELDKQAITGSPDNTTRVKVERTPGSGSVKVTGKMDSNASTRTFRLGLDRPARHAAQTFKTHLLNHGVSIIGSVKETSQQLAISDRLSPETCNVRENDATEVGGTTIAELPPPNWSSIFNTINKDSQNLYAELVLRQLGKICGSGTTKDGLLRVNQLLADAGASLNSHDFFDGSGMSVYNRVSPRTLMKLLIYADQQDWGVDWKNTFPIGGIDGSLEYRFLGTSLEGKIYAKTGTLKGVNALSGYMISASGRELAFSIIANDRPLNIKTATPYMDQALVEISEKF